MLDIVITGGTPSSCRGEKADIGISGERIVAIGAPGQLGRARRRRVRSTGDRADRRTRR